MDGPNVAERGGAERVEAGRKVCGGVCSFWVSSSAILQTWTVLPDSCGG